mgnify:CR=1 FL=1
MDGLRYPGDLLRLLFENIEMAPLRDICCRRVRISSVIVAMIDVVLLEKDGNNSHDPSLSMWLTV